MHLRKSYQHDAALLDGLFCVLLKHFASGRDRYAPSATIEQLGANFFLKRANLGRNRWLRAEAPLRSAREAAELGYLQKSLDLIEVH